MFQTVTPKEHKNFIAELDQWWSKLDWTIKQDIKKLIEPLKIESTSKLDYIDIKKYKDKLPKETIDFLNFRKELEINVNLYLKRLGDYRDIKNISAVTYSCNDNFDKMQVDYKKGLTVQNITKKFLNELLGKVTYSENKIKIQMNILKEINKK